VIAIVQVLIMRRRVVVDVSPVQQALKSVEDSYLRIERAVRDEIAKNREEGSASARQSREELANTLKGVGDTLNQQFLALSQTNDQRLERMRETVEQRLTTLQEENTKRLDQMRQDAATGGQQLREEISNALKGFGDSMVKILGELGSANERNWGMWWNN